MSNQTSFSNNTFSSNSSLSMPQICIIDGNSDIYGLGIRIGFYLQWYASILASAPRGYSGKVASDEVQGLMFSIVLFTVATFLALIIQTSTLQLPEVYIILLLVVGYHYYFIPKMFMALLSFIKQLLSKGEKDETGQKKHRGWEFILLAGLFFCAISCFQLWFWGGHFQDRNGKSNTCPSFGFGFIKIDLENTAFRAFNITYWVLLLILSFGFIMHACDLYIQKRKAPKSNFSSSSSSLKSGASSTRSSKEPNSKFDSIRFGILFIFMTVMVIAIEKSIMWNQITGVTTLAGAGQLIPFLIGLGSLFRVCYVGVKGDDRREES
ncbi:uncharacterized protein EAE98_008281 [Botrytis deweyae]|uniref:Uncharacterized protein n=1 Tax=Botrytis deweyae TaxID=2478750 RepID=A0ABQ7IEY1_9HELO|nr:uncharacterized protein EAE98_008281 [Botrytis deweyae]KAF7922070.1 hypothetical protein EAE98_008281 [Botrytis deweyae]